MSSILRCNNQPDGLCHKALVDSAIVTTCSHIFCTECAKTTGLSTAHPSKRICPACSCPLARERDALQMNLKPTEDYKTTILCGFDPETVLECAGRSLAFWNYQQSQEIRYQEHLVSALTHKYSQLSSMMNNLVEEANNEITSLQDQLKDLSVKNESLIRKNKEVTNMWHQKSSKLQQVQQLYDLAKQKCQYYQNKDLPSGGYRSESLNPKHGPIDHNSPTFHPHLASERHDVEVLHHHQRSGSAAGSYSESDRVVMPPPKKLSRSHDLPFEAKFCTKPYQSTNAAKFDNLRPTAQRYPPPCEPRVATGSGSIMANHRSPLTISRSDGNFTVMRSIERPARLATAPAMTSHSSSTRKLYAAYENGNRLPYAGGLPSFTRQ